MPVTTALAIFFLIWWVVLFAVLPWGVRGQHEGDGGEIVPGTDPGAPVLPRLLAQAGLDHRGLARDLSRFAMSFTSTGWSRLMD